MLPVELPDGDVNVIPALASARSGAEGGVKSERSDSCQATEMGFAYAVVPSNGMVVDRVSAKPRSLETAVEST